jgi:hypothetical protein
MSEPLVATDVVEFGTWLVTLNTASSYQPVIRTRWRLRL